MKYSLWLVLPEKIQSELQVVVDHLAATYDSPTFEPHATLVGGIEGEVGAIEEKMKQLVEGASELELSLGPVSFSTTYFQSVLVRVNSTAALMELNLKAKEIFGLANDVFMPHISLLYGVDSMKTREEVAAKILLSSTKFSVSELVLTPSTSDPKDWHHLASVRFGNGNLQ